MANNNLIRFDSLVIDGKAVPFEDGSVTLSGAAGFENDVHLTGDGVDFQSRKRVPRILSFTLEASATFNPADYAGHNGVQITARDSVSKRRALLTNCTFQSMGDVGAGPVAMKYNVLSPIQWL